MISREDIYKEMDILMSEIDGEEAIEEVNEEFPPRKDEMEQLLQTQNIEEFLKKYDEISTNKFETLLCFDIENANDLQKHIEENEITFDELKTETVRATREVLENIIYEAEEEEY